MVKGMTCASMSKAVTIDGHVARRVALTVAHPGLLSGIFIRIVVKKPTVSKKTKKNAAVLEIPNLHSGPFRESGALLPKDL
jgi:hypothetical protein